MELHMNYHIDPGHGWVEVTRAALDIDGIAPKISGYSYVKGDRVFLEEDCDAPLYLEAAQKRGWTIKLNEVHYNNDAPMRSYSRFKL